MQALAGCMHMWGLAEDVHEQASIQEEEEAFKILHPCSQPDWADWMEYSTQN